MIITMQPKQPYYNSINPWRAGYCDAVMNRPCKSPFPEGWRWAYKSAQYISGYMEGEAKRKGYPA